ncbi:MAG: response regulator [Alphaproteobacteria bacterium]|nr:response regulator [Alphaproteobacteria bacterium]
MSEQHKTEQKKILVVEDNDFVRMQLVRYLNEAGYEVVEAVDGASGLEQLNAQISLVVLDVRMAPMDGFEFIKAIRGRNADIPLIMVTGDQNPDLLNEASKWNVSAVLMKPVHKDRLLKMVDRAMEKLRKSS